MTYRICYWDSQAGAQLERDATSQEAAELDARKAAAAANAATEMWDAIQAKRDHLTFDGGVKVGAAWFHSDRDSVARYTALAWLGRTQPGATVLRSGWRTMADGVSVDMTVDLVNQILVTGFGQVAAIDDAAQAHKANMIKAADPTAYDFSGGWPVTFLG